MVLLRLGITYCLMIHCFSAAVSYTVAEQFNQSIEMEAITRSSRIGRDDGEGEIENGLVL